MNLKNNKSYFVIPFLGLTVILAVVGFYTTIKYFASKIKSSSKDDDDDQLI